MLGHAFVDPEMVIPEKKIPTTPAQIIFHRYYQVRISGLHLLEEATLEKFGAVTSGSSKDDVSIASAVRTANLTIAGMAELLGEGATFSVENPEKASEIFDVIQDHLIRWINNVEGSFNRRSAPLEGLRQLETLAEYLYPYAMRHRNASYSESHLYRSLRDAISRRGSIRLAAEKKDPKQELVIRPYKSITDDMTKELEKRERPWS